MKKGMLIAAAAGVLAGVAGFAVGKTGGETDPAEPSRPVDVHATHSPGEVADYWTEERKRKATGG